MTISIRGLEHHQPMGPHTAVPQVRDWFSFAAGHHHHYHLCGHYFLSYQTMGSVWAPGGNMPSRGTNSPLIEKIRIPSSRTPLVGVTRFHAAETDTPRPSGVGAAVPLNNHTTPDPPPVTYTDDPLDLRHHSPSHRCVGDKNVTAARSLAWVSPVSPSSFLYPRYPGTYHTSLPPTHTRRLHGDLTGASLSIDRSIYPSRRKNSVSISYATLAVSSWTEPLTYQSLVRATVQVSFVRTHFECANLFPS
ncbi:hypothetical protein QBC38DRAFT_168850 [Podospora fimiseda]|uniref:Uncharacterized protein n=1 Tax=Podospora fimiseda TaxID=252190 RepID=A0AAN7H0Q8_9PEZI|nr:hypothetical protein QBC38DRAFT_168850 [Podospora fimiseda]